MKNFQMSNVWIFEHWHFDIVCHLMLEICYLLFNAAFIKSLNRGCAASGLDLNSG